jgi:hypothetical protein
MEVSARNSNVCHRFVPPRRFVSQVELVIVIHSVELFADQSYNLSPHSKKRLLAFHVKFLDEC